MQTRHLSNRPAALLAHAKLWKGIFVCVSLAGLIWFANHWQQLILGVLLMIALFYAARWVIKTSIVAYTLTATHMQQHLHKGGWVLQWQNISKIGICQCQHQGWYQPLPWIGIKLKHYSPYLDSICPRITTQILLSQRPLLYVGLQQQQATTQFEDIVLDPKPYTSSDGVKYLGLQAMLANRMHYQREFFGYDVFISTSDLDRPAEEFVGLLRRYLAASKTD
ncbi:hypothetical protein VII00023_07184 [Vibrio ichthyoenteri ATCC 700023]|uniref:DUF2982 domain-containing protein n=1 Tax=Vibrio ichthyoenteri ATCC 700023 TaxID=870968 RepID=F9S3X4_9VIBR|nr:DUF2982 domain-containing protein [Vibrio ichthyoenteri]EGU37707.1 hypothetical protein VII00023_07184 [Vibrio ichthyoenteri ATCC 700023]